MGRLGVRELLGQRALAKARRPGDDNGSRVLAGLQYEVFSSQIQPLPRAKARWSAAAQSLQALVLRRGRLVGQKHSNEDRLADSTKISCLITYLGRLSIALLRSDW